MTTIRCKAKNPDTCPYHGTPFAIDETDATSIIKTTLKTAKNKPVYIDNRILDPRKDIDANALNHLTAFIAVYTPGQSEVALTMRELGIPERLGTRLFGSVRQRDAMLTDLKEELSNIPNDADPTGTMPEKDLLKTASAILGIRQLEIDTEIQHIIETLQRYAAGNGPTTLKDAPETSDAYPNASRALKAQERLIALKAVNLRINRYQKSLGRGSHRTAFTNLDATFS